MHLAARAVPYGPGSGWAVLHAVADRDRSALDHTGVDTRLAGAARVVHPGEVVLFEGRRDVRAGRRVARHLDQRRPDAQPVARLDRAPVESGHRHVLADRARIDRMAL